MKKYLIIFLLLSSLLLSAQSDSNNFISKKQWFVTVSTGIQMSGIKDEDFIAQNIAPAFIFGSGVWFTPEIAVGFGYKGLYFNTIADNDKHRYNYYFGEVILNVNSLVKGPNAKVGNWSLRIHPGAGLFYNVYYHRPNICAHIGAINSFVLTKKLSFFTDLSFIMGWDIYQGNDDILPSCVLGLNYSF